MAGVINIGRILIVILGDNSDDIVDEIVAMLKNHSDFKMTQISDDSTISFPKLTINLKQRKVYSDQNEITLTPKEYDILCLFVINKGNTLSHEQIYEKIWKDEAFDNVTNIVGCHVRSLRRKLIKAVPNAPFKIRCIRSVGYRFEINENA